MQNLNNAKVEGNRLELDEWFIIIKPIDLVDITTRSGLSFCVKHKTKDLSWVFDSMEEALEAIK